MESKHNIVIVRREDEQPEPLSDEILQQYAEKSDDAVSSGARMLAVVLLWVLVTAGAGILGLMLRLLHQ